MPILTERYYVRRIEEFVRDLACEIWYLNVNYFYIIFKNFEMLNRSSCFFIPMNIIDAEKTRLENYFSKLPVVSLSDKLTNNVVLIQTIQYV